MSTQRISRRNGIVNHPRPMGPTAWRLRPGSPLELDGQVAGPAKCIIAHRTPARRGTAGPDIRQTSQDRVKLPSRPVPGLRRGRAA